MLNFDAIRCWCDKVLHLKLLKIAKKSNKLTNYNIINTFHWPKIINFLKCFKNLKRLFVNAFKK